MSNDNETSSENDSAESEGRITYDARDDAIETGRTVATLTAIKNGQEPPELDDETARQVGVTFHSQRRNGPQANAAGPQANASSAPQGSISTDDARRNRIRDGSGVGMSHQGTRDYWEVFGYPSPDELTAEDYELWAARDAIASTLAYRPVAESWKNDPRIHDDGTEEDADPSEFEQDVQSLFDGTEEGKGLTYYWEWSDWKQRTGDYGLLFLGLDDGREMDQPVDVNELDSVEDLQYCNTYWQSDVVSWDVAGKYDTDDEKRGDVVRPDQPLIYTIETEHATASGDMISDTKDVHHTRLIHITEHPTSSEWIGKSCLEVHLNRLIDAEKTMGASAEAQYRNADRKFVGTAETDGTNGVDTEMLEEFDQQMWELVNDMRTTAYSENMNLDVISGDDVDPSGTLDSLWPFFAGASGMPQRIMTGSERGDLASSQDESNWYSNVGDRIQQFCVQAIIRPTLDRLLEYGVLSDPVDPEGSYTVVFPDLFELTDLEKAQLQQTRAQALKWAHDAIAAGADGERAYEYVGIPQGEESSGQEGSGDDLDAVNAIDRTNPSLRNATALTATGGGESDDGYTYDPTLVGPRKLDGSKPSE